MLSKSTHTTRPQSLTLWGTTLCLLLMSDLALAQPVEMQAPPTQNTSSAQAETWEQISIDNNPSGYRRTTLTTDPSGKVSLNSLEHLELTRFAQTISIDAIRTSLQTKQGNLSEFYFRLDNKPLMTIESTGIRKGDQMHITTKTGNTEKQSTLPWNDKIISTDFAGYLLETDPLAPGQKRTMQVFLPEYGQVDDVTHLSKGLIEQKQPDGSVKVFHVIEESMTLLPGSITTIYLTKDNIYQYSQTRQMGLTIVSSRTSKDNALKEIVPRMIDIGMKSLVKPTPTLNKGDRSQKVIYELSVPETRISQIPPHGRYQHVDQKAQGNLKELIVTVDARGGFPQNPLEDLSLIDQTEFLAETLYLEVSNTDIQKLARQVPPTQDSRQQAVALEKFVYQQMTRKDFSTAFATAAEVAQSLQGDCTEHAVLLAALLRAHKIPSRVALGLVYVDHLKAFGGHMWTEAWIDDRWLPLDATLGTGGIGAGHIKLAHSSLSEDSPFPIALFAPIIELLQDLKITIREQQ